MNPLALSTAPGAWMPLTIEPSKANPTEQCPATKGRRHSSPAVLARPMLLILQPLNGEGPIRSLSGGLGNAMTELTMQQARTYSEIVQLLTPAQQQQLSEFAKERETSLEDSIERLGQSGS